MVQPPGEREEPRREGDQGEGVDPSREEAQFAQAAAQKVGGVGQSSTRRPKLGLSGTGTRPPGSARAC
jgi:hypothetical protein